MTLIGLDKRYFSNRENGDMSFAIGHQKVFKNYSSVCAARVTMDRC